jgi:DNA-binding response OmpR family regulator
MNKKILLIDNDSDTLEMVTEALNYEGFTAIATEDSSDVPSLVAAHQPGLVLIDYLLNGINGGEICAQLKKTPATAGLPVILMSAYPRVLLSLGTYYSDAFIAKPFDLDDLTQIINQHLLAANSAKAVG